MLRFACVSGTSLGREVDPEVCNTSATSLIAIPGPAPAWPQDFRSAGRPPLVSPAVPPASGPEFRALRQLKSPAILNPN
jgi:hypothetical protein